MSLLSKFVRNNLLDAIHEELLEASEEKQQAIIKELHDFACEVLDWTESRLNNYTGDCEHE